MSTNAKSHTHHILPLSTYLTIGTILIVLTGVTVWIAQIDFGSYNLLIAMIIAAVKASLVALFFMHLKYDSKLYLLIFIASIFFLAVFIIITMFDTLRRGDIYDIKGQTINPNAVIYDSPITHPDSTFIETDSLNDTINLSDSTSAH